jgi:ethanolamine utilization protein EutQ
METSRQKKISVFVSGEWVLVPYADAVARAGHGQARIARLVDRAVSGSMGVGVAEYGAMTVEWTLPFDEMITVIDGNMDVRSEGLTHHLQPGDVAWFPGGTSFTYIVETRVVVSYAIYPAPDKRPAGS